MERWVTKVICGILMWISLLICFLAPLKVAGFFYRKGERGQHYLDVLTCFAGGVFLACYLLYMAPEVRFLIDENLLKPYHIDYPVPEVRLLLVSSSCSFSRGWSPLSVTSPRRQEMTRKRLAWLRERIKTTWLVRARLVRLHLECTGAIIFYLAMSIDSIFEGMAIGLQRASSQVWIIFIGIISHEVVITFCLGLQVINNLKGKTRRILILGVLYSLMNPAGVLLTATMYETRAQSGGMDLANGIVQGFAAGGVHLRHVLRVSGRTDREEDAVV